MNDESEAADNHGGPDLCIHCLEPVGYNANFCVHCRAPLGFLAGVVPYYSVFAEGFILRTAVTQPRNLTTVLGVWVIFGNYLIMGLSMLWISLSVYPMIFSSWLNGYYLTTYLGMAAIGGVGVVRCTLNFASYKPVVSLDEEGV